MSLTSQQIAHYREHGYLVVPSLFDQGTVRRMIAHYMELRAKGPWPGDTGGTQDQPDDPNHRYPRMINMHGWDEGTQVWATRPDVLEAVGQLIGDDPVLQQTMLYFKPPGARGQALHQDQQYITLEPLIGLWVALDRADKEVGQMVVVPGSHRQGLLRVEKADTTLSFTRAQAVLPAEASMVGLDMEPGDGLYFAGKTVHGSHKNTTTDRWRRSFICHYIGQHAQKFEPAQGYHVSHVH